jgi:Protein of unknown function (DUF2934)
MIDGAMAGTKSGGQIWGREPMRENRSNYETRVRERAYKLWEENGRPHGRDVELWEQARELIAIEDNPESGRLPNPTSTDPASQGVEEADIQENYGEVPGRLTDQGDRPQTPSTRTKRS